jgi:hypothetical protein
MELISTIAIRRSSRDMLKKLGNKGQIYDEIIQDLIKCKDQDSPDCNLGIPRSSEFRNPSKLTSSTSQDTLPYEINKKLCEAADCNKEATTGIKVNVGELGTVDLELCKSCSLNFKSQNRDGGI